MELLEFEILQQAINNLKKQIALKNCVIAGKNHSNKIFDTTMDINGINFMCEIKRNITNSNFNILLKRLLNQKQLTSSPILVVAQYIYPSLMDKLAKHNINVLDSAGNCIIHHKDLLWIIKGEKNNLIKETSGRAFQDTGIKIIFHLLLHPESVNQPYRVIQNNTGVSLGAINNVFEELINENFILKTKNGRFLKNKPELFEKWVTAYNQTLKPKLLLKQMTFKNKEKRDKWMSMILPDGMYWGGRKWSSFNR